MAPSNHIIPVCDNLGHFSIRDRQVCRKRCPDLKLSSLLVVQRSQRMKNSPVPGYPLPSMSSPPEREKPNPPALPGPEPTISCKRRGSVCEQGLWLRLAHTHLVALLHQPSSEATENIDPVGCRCSNGHITKAISVQVPQAGHCEAKPPSWGPH